MSSVALDALMARVLRALRTLAVLLAGVAALVSVAAWAWWSQPKGPAGQGAGPVPTLEQVYRGVERTLRERDGIYVATISVAADMGLVAYTGTLTRWADVRRDVAREDARYDRMPGSSTLTTRDARFVRYADGQVATSSGRLWTCYGAGVAASAVLGCPGPTERSTTTVESGTFNGTPSLVLVGSGTLSGSDETLTFSRRLYLDRRTFLPVGLEGEGSIDFGRVAPTWERHAYRTDFVAPASLAPGFFDPASIGYAPPDVTKPLDAAAGFSVYWLGERVPSEAGRPGLVLARVDAPTGGPGYRYLLQYADAADPFGPPLVTLQLWPRAAWDSVVAASRGMNAWESPCWQRRDVTLGSGDAVIFSGYDTSYVVAPAAATPAGGCPTGAPDRFSAHAFLGDTVVQIDAPSRSSMAGTTRSPFNDREAMIALARLLHLR